MATASEAAQVGPGKAGVAAGLDPGVLGQIQESDAFKSFVSRSGAAQEKAKSALAKRGTRLSVGDIKPSPINIVPAPTSLRHTTGASGALALGGTDNTSRLLMVVQEKLQQVASSKGDLVSPEDVKRAVAIAWQGGQGALKLATSARTKRRARERSINQRFRFRTREDGHTEEAVESTSQTVPEDIGGLKSTRFLTLGLPIRMARNEVGIKAWCRYSCIDEQMDEDILAMQGCLLRVVEIRGTCLRVSPSRGCNALLPMQIFQYCSAAETLLHLPWRTSESIPVPSDFVESVAAMDHSLDPGAEPGASSGAIAVSPQGSSCSDARVRRFKPTPAVGWPGAHNSVVRHTIRAGRSVAFAPDGARVRARLHEALEAAGGRTRRLVPDLPKEAEFTLGSGDVCDALECAVSRMATGEIAALCCTDASLVQPEGPFAFEPALGPGGDWGGSADARARTQPCMEVVPGPDPAGSASSSLVPLADAWADPHQEPYRVLLMVEILDVEGPDFALQGVDADERLRHAAERKEAGTRAFKAGRTRLALERYRRTANLLSVFFPDEPGTPPQQLLQTCWLNAAQCHLLLGGHEAARRYCDAVLRRDPENLKALFRRASACQALGAHPLQTIEDLGRVVAREPENRRAQQMLREAQRGQGQHERASRDLFRRACSDLVGDFDGLVERLQRARAAGDGAAAEAALEELRGALPRLTAAQAGRLRLGQLLAALEAAPPGGSEGARRLAADALTKVRGLVMADGRG